MASPVQVLLAEALALAQGNPKTLELREEEGSVRLALELREPSARNPMADSIAQNRQHDQP